MLTYIYEGLPLEPTKLIVHYLKGGTIPTADFGYFIRGQFEGVKQGSSPFKHVYAWETLTPATYQPSMRTYIP